MIRNLFIIFCTLLAIPSWAEPVQVVSGDHEDFSRLVLQLPRPTNWSAGTVEGGYIFKPNEGEIQYKLDQVFDFITKDRIFDVQDLGDGALFISTDNRFFLDAFDLRDNHVVLDIKDGTAQKNSRFEQPFDQSRFTVEKTTAQLVDTEVNLTPPVPTQAMISPTTPIDIPIVAQQHVWRLDALSDTPNPRVSEMEKRLFDQISRAVSQDLLDADLPDTESVVAEVEKLTQTPASDESADTALTSGAARRTDDTHIRIQTAVDRDRKPVASQTINLSEENCFASHALDIQDWGQPLNEGLQIAAYRSQTLGEFDQPSPQGVEALVKYYLFLTFGAEAKAALDAYGLPLKDEAALRKIAEVMDGVSSVETSAFKTQVDCDGPSAFWSVISREKLPPVTDQQLDSIIAYFSGLPLHLRKHLGPRISEKFLASGYVTAAELVQNAILRVADQSNDALDFLNAEMMIADGNSTNAVEILDTIVSHDGPEAALALIRSIDVQKESLHTIDPKVAENAEILAIEHRNTPLEAQLIRASIDARIHSNRPDLALQALLKGTNRTIVESNEFQRLLNSASAGVASSSDDLEFVKQAISVLSADAAALLSDETKLTLADRLMGLGFVDLAAEFGKFESPPSNRAKILLADIHRNKGDLDSALAYLMHIDEPRANRLRGEIYLHMKQPRLAAKEFARGDQADLTNAALFLAEDWEPLSQQEDTQWSEVASFLSAGQLEPNEIAFQPTLAGADTLLDRSRIARERFGSLLNQ
ncbi:hypothetical protein EDD53_2392 [Pacificibacter maritimus]|uniref:Tetratricopeptide repeat protein n=1 Tax=Pacificibacter maritimus TaxID=762213 RepID=A0A3N4U1F0_9RHOB|nr:hypothetical protein [Pacificibacter maritimus]RPE64633.1 hypothetical protein EDD53_2392 [Pacificibacter maritimus]